MRSCSVCQIEQILVYRAPNFDSKAIRYASIMVFNILCNQWSSLSLRVCVCVSTPGFRNVLNSRKTQTKCRKRITKLSVKKNHKQEEKCPWEEAKDAHTNRDVFLKILSFFLLLLLLLRQASILHIIHFSLNQSHLTASSLSSYYYHHYVSLTRKKE